ncbi:MAG: hypothetical protein AAF539_15535 [Planctomycetota bacterium]
MVVPMNRAYRILCQVYRTRCHYFICLVATTLFGSGLSAPVADAEDAASFYTDPATGIVYRKVFRTVERPVVETKMTRQEQTVYTPETVTRAKPEIRRTYQPVTQFSWQPRIEGRWNPFRQPRVAYHHVPETRWQARDEIVTRNEVRTQWKAEKRFADVPETTTRISRQEVVDFEPVGRVAPAPVPGTTLGTSSLAAVQPNLSPEIASRLRPLSSGEVVQPGSAGYASTQTLATRQRIRSDLESGMRPTDLVPRSGGYVAPPTVATGVAGLPVMSLWR